MQRVAEPKAKAHSRAAKARAKAVKGFGTPKRIPRALRETLLSCRAKSLVGTQSKVRSRQLGEQVAGGFCLTHVRLLSSQSGLRTIPSDGKFQSVRSQLQS